MFLAAASNLRPVYRELDIIHQLFWGQVWQEKNLHKNLVKMAVTGAIIG